MSTSYVQSLTEYLAGSGVIIGATSIVLQNFTDIYGNVLIMSDFGSKGYITLEPDTTNEEAATFTGVIANANGTYTLTGISTALAQSPYTETSGLIRAHAGGTKVVITDNVAFWNTFANKTNNETITGIWTAPTGGTGSQIATATDIANAISGASGTATNLVAGTTKLSVAAVSAPNPIAVGDNDPRVPTAGEALALAGTSGTPGSGNKYVTNNDTALTGASVVLRLTAGGKITTSTIDTGVSALQIVQLDGSARLPAVDGSQLTNLTGSRKIAARTSQLALGSGSTAETDIISNTSLAGGSLSTGRCIRYECYFTYTPSNSSANIILRCYFGGSVAASFQLTGDNEAFNGHLVATVAYVAAGSQYNSGIAIATTTTVSSGGGTTQAITASGTLSIDESSAQNVRMTVQGSASNTLTVETVQGATIHLI